MVEDAECSKIITGGPFQSSGHTLEWLSAARHAAYGTWLERLRHKLPVGGADVAAEQAGEATESERNCQGVGDTIASLLIIGPESILLILKENLPVTLQDLPFLNKYKISYQLHYRICRFLNE